MWIVSDDVEKVFIARTQDIAGFEIFEVSLSLENALALYMGYVVLRVLGTPCSWAIVLGYNLVPIGVDLPRLELATVFPINKLGCFMGNPFQNLSVLILKS